MKAPRLACASLLAGLAIVAMPLAGGATNRVFDLGNGSYVCLPGITSVTTPDANGVGQHYGGAGATVTVSGVNFLQTGCSLTEVLIGHATIPRSVVTVGAGGSKLTFKLPADASGAVSVVSTDGQGNQRSSNGNFVFIETPTVVVQTSQPIEGSVEQVTGSGYAPFGGASALPGALVTGSYSQCNGASRSAPATPSSDATLTLGVPPTYCDGPLVLEFVAPADASRPVDCTHSPASPAYNCIRITLGAGIIDVSFNVGSLTPQAGSTVSPESTIVVTGSGFGPSGSAHLAGVAAAATWTDTSIAVSVPAGVGAGGLTLQRSTGDLQEVQVGLFSVVAHSQGEDPIAAALAQSSSLPAQRPAAATLASAPARAPQAALTSPRPASSSPSPRAASITGLKLRIARHVAKPGIRVPFTVSITLNRKPVAGAQVHMRLTRSPGKGARVVPMSGRTGRTGLLRGAVVLSKTPGPTCIVATWGKHKTSACITDSIPPPKAAGSAPFGFINPQKPVSAWFTTAGIALVIFAILVNVNVLGRTVLGRALVKRGAGRILRRRRPKPPQP